MSRNIDGEFELVLGNKQLLSMFFLVVVLFGVFFSLGYMVGKTAMPGQAMAAQSGTAPAPDTSSRPSPIEAKDGSPAPPNPAPAEPAAAPESSQPKESKELKETKPEPAAVTPASSQAPPLVARDLHLQIAAVRVREDAEALAGSLRKKGYEPLVNTQTRDGWYRVVIGPFPNERAAQNMKVRLGKDGYKSILKKP